MADIIQLLPDSIANQIAAGEVIQRPASVVKELMENAIDAGATEIKLILKDSGKTLVQVLDNGKGMSVTDARMSFERHATSKIRTANDLFHIKTMGFRGEALASIAAIAQVEMFTKKEDDELGTRLVVEGSTVAKQEPVQTANGTSISVKNLFYNVPARRKFLKSDPIEFKHILDEFQRVALAHPDIFFGLHHNNNEIYHLPKSNLRQRIVGILGKQINEKLIPISEEMDLVKFSGFVARPEACKRTKGDQFLFVNQRFIRSFNLNHAIKSAFDNLLQKEQYPFYVIFMDLDPATIDINVHPTKTEIKFEDERLIYNYLKVCVKHALGQYSLAPMLDFSVDSNFANTGQNQPSNYFSGREKTLENPKTSETFKYNPWPQDTQARKDNLKSWEDIYSGLQEVENQNDFTKANTTPIESEGLQTSGEERELLMKNTFPTTIFQMHYSYIVKQIKSGLMIVDQQAAHERILYEQYLDLLNSGEYVSQRELFPKMVELEAAKASVLSQILPTVNALGFDMAEFGQNTFIIHGTPAGLDNKMPVEQLMEKIVDQYTINYEFQLGIQDNLARSMAVSACIKRGRNLEKEEMNLILDQLFACKMPYKSPSGKNCFISIELDEIQKRFNQ